MPMLSIIIRDSMVMMMMNMLYIQQRQRLGRMVGKMEVKMRLPNGGHVMTVI